jgi:hypothetical protein
MTQPAHFKLDADYASRKGAPDHVKTWAVGQAMAVEGVLDAMLDPARNTDGIFPELVFFDCHSCHHPMSNIRWEAREGHGIAPGTPRLNDANLILLAALFDRVDPPAAQQLRTRTKAMHQASQKGHDATLVAVKALRDAVSPLTAKLAQTTFDASDLRALLAGLIDRGTRGDYVDYAAAEQATMAITAALDGMKAGKMVSEAQYKALMAALDGAYAAVEKDENYSPRQFLTALQAFGAALTRT